MKKYVFLIFISILLWGCDQSFEMSVAGQQNNISDDQIDKLNTQMTITPGRGVGPININSNLSGAISTFGKPDREDAAMGNSFISWYSNHNPDNYQFQIFADNGNGGEASALIKKIRITSPLYQTKGNIGTGINFTAIAKQFNLTPSPNPRFKGRDKLYDDLKAGIGFEIRDDGVCSAIIVHASGDASFTYINLN